MGADYLKVQVNGGLMLKPSGRIADLDWKKVDAPFGAPESIRFDKIKRNNSSNHRVFK